MNHALVVGGTGMLAGVTRWLAAQGRPTSVIARNEARLRQFEASDPNIRGIPVNYYEPVKLTGAIHRNIEERGGYETERSMRSPRDGREQSSAC